MRPRTMDELFQWIALEAVARSPEPPERIHARHYPPGEDPGHKGRDAIIGPPFTRRFQRYLDGERPMTPVRRALRRMRSGDRRQSPEYALCYAFVEGGQPVEHAQVIMRCSDEVVVRALSLLWELTQIEEARHPVA